MKASMIVSIQLIRLLVLLLFTTSAWASQTSQEAPTSLDDILSSVQIHFPLIKTAQAEIDARQAMVQAAQGVFDPVLEGSYKNRLSGYYDGSSLESYYRKRLPGFGAEVFAGVRHSSGTFPTYENSLSTTNDGESRVGISLSLWRNRDFDEYRYQLANANVEVDSQYLQLQQDLIDTLRDAYIAYAQWLQAARLLSDYNELLGIAAQRAEAVNRSVERGDAAEILAVDNELAVLQRQSLVINSQRLLDASAYRLSLFYRYSDGSPRMPVYTEGLTIPEEESVTADDIEALVDRVTKLDPRISMARLSQEKFSLEERLADNSAKPQIDLRLYNSRDFGSGLASLQGAENVVDIKFSFPLATNSARGKASAARARINGLEHSIRQYVNEVRADLEIALVNLKATQQMESIAVQELDSSFQLAEAEARRFEAGLSDFFQLNQREQVVAEAELKRWSAHFEHQVALANFYRISMDIEALGVK